MRFNYEREENSVDFLTKHIEIEKILNSKYLIPVFQYSGKYGIVFKIIGNHADLIKGLYFNITEGSAIEFIKYPERVIPLRISLNEIGVFNNLPNLIDIFNSEYEMNKYIICPNCNTKILKENPICEFCGYINKISGDII